jgi:hypothetical protein
VSIGRFEAEAMVLHQQRHRVERDTDRLLSLNTGTTGDSKPIGRPADVLAGQLD